MIPNYIIVKHQNRYGFGIKINRKHRRLSWKQSISIWGKVVQILKRKWWKKREYLNNIQSNKNQQPKKIQSKRIWYYGDPCIPTIFLLLLLRSLISACSSNYSSLPKLAKNTVKRISVNSIFTDLIQMMEKYKLKCKTYKKKSICHCFLSMIHIFKKFRKILIAKL